MLTVVFDYIQVADITIAGDCLFPTTRYKFIDSNPVESCLES